MTNFTPAIARAGVCAIGLAVAAALVATPARGGAVCAPAGEWSVPGGGRIAAQDILARAAGARVVLLGESHDNADHHRWELQTVAALAALRPKIALGFEMFPRRVQGALERWVAGELSEQEFLQASDWSRVWSYDAAFYLPLFHFARLNRVPMRALNVERELVRAVAEKGFAAIPEDRREGVSTPAAASEHYIEHLFEVYVQHPDRTSKSTPARTDPEFRRFVEAQLLWDRAMAQGLVETALRNPDTLAIGIMGSRHVAHGDGVAHQIESLGVKPVVSLLPWDASEDCAGFSAGLATAVFGLPAAVPTAAAPPPRLGILVENAPDGVKVSAVTAGSIAETTGLRAGDVLVEVAGAAVKTVDEVRALVGRMAPGTWLPLKLKRQSALVELTARFPANK